MGDATAFEFRAVERLTGFAGFLRSNGFAVGGGETIELLRAAERVGIGDERVLRWSLQALLCGRSEQWRRFDELFDAWFFPAKDLWRPATGNKAAEHAGAAPAGGRAARSCRPRRDDARTLPISFCVLQCTIDA